MFYRVRADFPFTDEDEANDFFHDCEVAFPKASVINPGQVNEEIPHCHLEKCFHDYATSGPCFVMKQLPSPLP